MNLILFLKVAAALQLSVAALNLVLIRLMGWKDELGRLSLLVREVFQVHVWFISVTLGLFGILTWRFAGEMTAGANAVGQWLAAGIGLFWGFRTVLQITYYSSSHWRGRLDRTLIHIALLGTYGGFALVYLWAAFGSKGGPS